MGQIPGQALCHEVSPSDLIPGLRGPPITSPSFFPNTLLQKCQNCVRLPRWFNGKESTFQCRKHKRHIWSLGAEDPLEKEMETHSSTLAWKIPWTEEPGRLQSLGLQRVGHDWVTMHNKMFSTCSTFLLLKIIKCQEIRTVPSNLGYVVMLAMLYLSTKNS